MPLALSAKIPNRWSIVLYRCMFQLQFIIVLFCRNAHEPRVTLC